MTNMTTLCYLKRGNEYLMLHRIKKESDINAGKWIGIGGHFEFGESPEECMKREVFEETGFTVTDWKYRGLVTFVSDKSFCEYMHLFIAEGWTGAGHECSEGVLEWVDIDRLNSLNMWQGDKVFLKLIKKDVPFFSLKLSYSKGDLVEAVLNGKAIDISLY